MNLKIEIENTGNEYVVKLVGEIDVHSAGELRDVLIPLSEVAGNDVKIDMSGITFLDSTGLGIFIAAYKSSEKNNSRLTLIRVRDRVFRLFKVTGIDTIMDVRGELEVDGSD